ncbi:NAD(P)/FAD-dependent oxidoreductase [Gordonia sp. KTR9]|uniref:NAD(P)/FAD-dependent oxidoreductase n=1 Tax=Gordonia sp. KTR9 TaxID=337191 RepID=UPI00027DE3C2|nr:FAD-dependent oxidoreductase [Gordonia sp. KTR9]AFR49151.1 Glycine/D-amino acid oxidases (deaminating) [Gordonia sp. KTR9]
MPRVSDVAVVGAGIIGLSAAYRLVRQGLSVTVYDVGRPGHGQSAGQSRIFRHAHDDRRLVDLAVRARHHWDVWSDEFGIPLISPDGAVMLGDAVPRRRGLLERAGVTVVPLDAQGLREVMPVLADYQGEAMLDVDGGSIDTRSAIAGLSGRLSGTFVHEEVLAAHSDGDTVTIRTPTTVGEHGAAVVCAGRGTAPLARGLGVAIPVRLGAHVRVSFAVRDSNLRLPTLQDGSGHFGADAVYAAGYPDRSAYGLGIADDIDAHDDGTLDDATRLGELADAAGRYVATALPGLDPTPRDIVHCWVTTLPWGDDGVALWRTGPVVAVAGHNMFKHAPVIGEALAETVVAGRVPSGFAPEDRLGGVADKA